MERDREWERGRALERRREADRRRREEEEETGKQKHNQEKRIADAGLARSISVPPVPLVALAPYDPSALAPLVLKLEHLRPRSKSSRGRMEVAGEGEWARTGAAFEEGVCGDIEGDGTDEGMPLHRYPSSSGPPSLTRTDPAEVLCLSDQGNWSQEEEGGVGKEKQGGGGGGGGGSEDGRWRCRQ